MPKPSILAPALKRIGLSAPDPNTLVINLSDRCRFRQNAGLSPSSLFVRTLRSQQRRFGADADQLLYNGPFKITRWVHGSA